MINEHALACALVDLEPEVSRFPDAITSITPTFSVSSEGDIFCKVVLHTTFFSHMSGYEACMRWLENDPRTTLSSFGDLRIETIEERDGYVISRTVDAQLPAEDIQLLRDLGKLVTNSYSLDAVAC